MDERPSTGPAGLILQHEDAAPPALFADWCESRGIPYEVLRVWEDGLPDDPRDHGRGSARSAPTTRRAATDAPAWVDEEVRFLRRALDADVPVLGLCFGGQALAAAAGAQIAPADPPEVGWFEIETDSSGRDPGRPVGLLPLRPVRPAAGRGGNRPLARGHRRVPAGSASRPAVPPRGDAGDSRRLVRERGGATGGAGNLAVCGRRRGQGERAGRRGCGRGPVRPLVGRPRDRLTPQPLPASEADEVSMRLEGVEPPRPCEHGDLNAARLPVPPQPREIAI